MFSNFTGSGKPKRTSLDDNAAGLIAHFEHSYDARLIATMPKVSPGSMLSPTVMKLGL